MRLVRWNPTQDLVSLREAMDHLFEESWVKQSSGSLSDSSNQAWRLPVDVYSTDQEIVIQAAIPGIDPEAIEITIEGDTLTIRGDMPDHYENVNYLFRELSTGRFIRALNLNIPVDSERAEASFNNGLLTLIIPKAEAIKPRQIKVKSA